MKKKNDEDWILIRSRIGGYYLPFIFLFVGILPIIKSSLVVNSKIKAQGEIISISADTTKLRIEGKEQVFLIPSYILNHIDKSKINNGDYVKILYRYKSQTVSCIEKLEINGEILYEYKWMMSFYDAYDVCIWFAIIGIVLIPFAVRSRNRIVREGGFDVAGPIVSSFVKVYPEDDDTGPTDVDYKEYSSIINDENLVYDSDMDYSVYKTDDKEIISVVFSDENGAYCRYFTLPDTEGEDYSQLAELANDIRNNADKYAEIDLSV